MIYINNTLTWKNFLYLGPGHFLHLVHHLYLLLCFPGPLLLLLADFLKPSGANEWAFIMEAVRYFIKCGSFLGHFHQKIILLICPNPHCLCFIFWIQRFDEFILKFFVNLYFYSFGNRGFRLFWGFLLYQQSLIKHWQDHFRVIWHWNPDRIKIKHEIYYGLPWEQSIFIMLVSSIPVP